MKHLLGRARLTRPHNFVGWRHFQQLSHNSTLAVSAHDRENLSEIDIDISVEGGEITSVTAVGITAVEKDKRCVGISLDDRLHVSWRG